MMNAIEKMSLLIITALATSIAKKLPFFVITYLSTFRIPSHRLVIAWWFTLIIDSLYVTYFLFHVFFEYSYHPLWDSVLEEGDDVLDSQIIQLLPWFVGLGCSMLYDESATLESFIRSGAAKRYARND